MLVCKVLPPLLRPSSSSKKGVTFFPRMPAASADSSAPATSDSTSSRGNAASAGGGLTIRMPAVVPCPSQPKSQ